MNVKLKSIATTTLVVFNIALAGAVIGAWQMHRYDQAQSAKTSAAVKDAIKTASVAQAPSK